MQVANEVYKTENITFLLVDDKILVKTYHQTFIVRYDHYNYRKQLNTLRDLIRSGDIERMDDLLSYCNLHPGKRGFMYGLELKITRLERHMNV